MTIGIAAVCAHEGRYAIVLCCDFQGTRGDFIKADDTDKIRDFKYASVLFAGDVDAGVEFSARLEEVVREFNLLEKPEEDFDLRANTYLGLIRALVRKVIRERQNHAISLAYGLSLDEYHSVDAPSTTVS